MKGARKVLFHVLCTTITATPLLASAVGPGTITATVINNGSTGDQTIVGNTTVL